MRDEPRSPVVLLEVAHEEGVAAVCRDEDDGSLWLTADLGSGGWWDIEGYRFSAEETDLVRAFGGRLPARAAVAELRDVRDAVHEARVGGGVWLVVVPRSVPAEPAVVLFRDATGAILAPERPSSARVEPLSDADVPCPACEGREWDLVTRPDRDPGQAERVIECRRCGYEALVYIGPRPTRQEIPPELEEPLEKAGGLLGGLARFALGKWQDYALEIDFPIYGLGPEWTGSRSVAGFTTSGVGRAYAVELLHGAADDAAGPLVLVETMREEDERLTVHELVTTMLEQGLETVASDDQPEHPPATLSDPARQLVEHLRELNDEHGLARRAARADRWHTNITVDGEAVEFLVAEADELTAGAAAIGELDITILTRRATIGSVHLRRVALSDYERKTGPEPA